MKKFNILFFAVFITAHLFSQTISDFENLSLSADSFWNGSDLTGGYNSGLAGFVNSYNTSFNSWSGFSYSNQTNDTTAGAGNQYSAVTASGVNGSATYAVANGYGDMRVRLNGAAAGRPVKGFYVTNTTYAYQSLKNGDQFAKKFGGVSGNDPDWFRLTVKGWYNGAPKAEQVQVYLADYRFTDNSKDYILKTWHWVDLQTLGSVDSVFFQLESTDTAGGYGMNNPAYFALDNFTTLEQVPFQTLTGFEDLTLATDTFWDGSDLTGGFASGGGYFYNSYSTSFNSWNGFTYSNVVDSVTPGSANQYGVITGSGYNNSPNFLIANSYGNTRVRLTGKAAGGKLVKGFYVTNTTYAYNSMLNGDMFAKKFGGATGTDPDWYRLTVKGYSNGALKPESVEFYLADYRGANSADDYIVRDWRWVNLQPLGNVDSLTFVLESTDTAGGFGMNNPAYFAIDNFITADTAYALPVANDDAAITNYATAKTIAVLSNDSNIIANPYTVELISSPLVNGATATVKFNQVVYTPAIGLVAADTLYYRVYDDLGFADTAKIVIKITGITSVENITDAFTFGAYPNPFNETLNIYTPVANEQQAKISVYSITGALIARETVTDATTIIPTANWQAGVYVVQLAAGDNFVTKKLIKQ